MLYRTACCAMAAACALAASAPAATINFSAISNNSGNAAAVAPQFAADVTDAGGGLVSFDFSNAGPIGSVISEIYWDSNGTYVSVQTVATNWSVGGSPPDLPEGNTVGFDGDLYVTSDNPSPQKGIDAGESAVFVLDTGATFAQTLTDLQDGTVRIGMHVISIDPSGNSDAFVTVPEPGSLALAALGLGLVAVRRRR